MFSLLHFFNLISLLLYVRVMQILYCHNEKNKKKASDMIKLVSMFAANVERVHVYVLLSFVSKISWL